LVEMIAAPTLGAGNKERVQSLSRAHRKRSMPFAPKKDGSNRRGRSLRDGRRPCESGIPRPLVRGSTWSPDARADS